MNPEKFPRPATQAAQFRAAEYSEGREEEMNRLAEKYRAIQVTIDTLKQKLQQGIEYVTNQNDPRIEEQALALRKEVQTEIDAALEEREAVETSIRGKGGNPNDYLVQ